MATRTLDTSFADVLDDSVVQPFYTVDMDFDEGAVRFWTGPGDLVVGGTVGLRRVADAAIEADPTKAHEAAAAFEAAVL